jgi:hypothetical protein
MDSPSYQSIFNMFLNNSRDPHLSPFPFLNLGDGRSSFSFDPTFGADPNSIPPPSQSDSAPIELATEMSAALPLQFSDTSMSSTYGVKSLLEMNVISERESHDLVELYWSHCHIAGPCLDPELHSYDFLRSSHTFLFNCVCAVAAKFYRYKIGLAEKILDVVASQLQQVIFNDSPKIETAQGLFLLSHWHGKGSRTYSRTWMIASNVNL